MRLRRCGEMRERPLRLGLLAVILCGALMISSCGCYGTERALAGDWYAPAEGLYLHMAVSGKAALVDTAGPAPGLCRGQWRLEAGRLSVVREGEAVAAGTLSGPLEPVSDHMFLWHWGETAAVFVRVDWYLGQTDA